MALRAGVDWLEAGTPLIIAEGMNGVRALRERFPEDADRRRPEDDGRRLSGGRDDGQGGRDARGGDGAGPRGNDSHAS